MTEYKFKEGKDPFIGRSRGMIWVKNINGTYSPEINDEDLSLPFNDDDLEEFEGEDTGRIELEITGMCLIKKKDSTLFTNEELKLQESAINHDLKGIKEVGDLCWDWYQNGRLDGTFREYLTDNWNKNK